MVGTSESLHGVTFHLPRKAVDTGVEDAGVSIEDPVVRHLLAALFPTTAKPDGAHPMFRDHVVLALMAHLGRQYGGVGREGGTSSGGLAAWQERRAKELMRATLQEEIPVSLVARECGLSVRHFARAFRKSAGVSPHRWLLNQRVECARKLLRDGIMPLAEVALACGFADQSHFTRVFRAVAGVSPGAWRRTNGLPDHR